ncbi:RlmE family RNA methyltransferase [Halorientalis pallida]|uniref:Ribosomal RNA large subunit methyltransferase E n=1 Tax=Halorientalis pallida TaxID=2479928 RepID=A0A498KV93_9EURY|nr:23S rRNA (uridine(2552)-2'-O)-methyltransferase [Halorientalis pallida]RXK46412.1 TRAM domain-containing protein [Halorientalis pallida]
MTRKDEYYNRAKQEGYRSRSAYKLKQLDRTANLLHEGATVVDLGAAPGGWLQVAQQEVGEAGTVVGVDRQRIDALDGVETVRGDMTEDSTKDEVREIVGEVSGSQPEAGETPSRAADVVCSDMAPNMTGEYDLDHARSVHLVRQALEVALDLLAPGGDFVAKVFDGQDLSDLKGDIEPEFEYVREVRPDASRESSSELFLVAKGRLTAPVAEGDTVTVEIVDTGHEGDGIAKLEGYTLFVSGAETGEEVEVRIDEIKPKYGFAQPVE